MTDQLTALELSDIALQLTEIKGKLMGNGVGTDRLRDTIHEVEYAAAHRALEELRARPRDPTYGGAVDITGGPLHGYAPGNGPI